jgi:hypothetical protein
MRLRAARPLTGGITAAFLALGVLAAPPAHAAAGDITTLAGGPGSGPANGLDQYVVAVALTPSRIWVADALYPANVVGLRVIDRATGLESEPVFAMPMPTRDQNWSWPTLAPLPNGNVLVAYNGDRGGVVDEVSATGQVGHVAGGGTAPLGMDRLDPKTTRLAALNGVAVSSKGDIFLAENAYVPDRDVYTSNSRILKIGSGGKMTPYAGETSWAVSGPGYGGDGGPALAASFDTVMGLTTDPAGNLYVADYGNERVRRIAPGAAGTAGIVTTVLTPTYVTGIAYDKGGLYVGDRTRCRVQRLDAQGLTTVAGTGTCGWDGDGGTATAARLSTTSVSVAAGEIAFIEETFTPSFTLPVGGSQLRLVDSTGTMRSITRVDRFTPPSSGDGGPALKAQLGQYTSRAAVDVAGNIYATYGRRVRRISPDGTITTVAGTGRDTTIDTGLGGPATAATLTSVTDVAVAPGGDLYISGENRIYRVDAAGTITAVVGDGAWGVSPDGTPATLARVAVGGFTFDPVTGGLVFLDGCRVRRLDSAGALLTVAGPASVPPGGAYCGHAEDGALASESRFGRLDAIGVDALGRLLVLEVDWNAGGDYKTRVRRIGLDGTISTLAGAGTSRADGVPATTADITDNDLSMRVDGTGRVLLIQRIRGLVRRVGLDGTVSTIVGGGTGPDGGPAATALLLQPSDAVTDAQGDLYIACQDGRTPYGGGAIRKVTQP